MLSANQQIKKFLFETDTLVILYAHPYVLHDRMHLHKGKFNGSCHTHSLSEGDMIDLEEKTDTNFFKTVLHIWCYLTYGCWTTAPHERCFW